MMQLEAKNVVKQYKQRKKTTTLISSITNMIRPKYELFPAVRDINFTISRGEAVGYVGPNGSGKSTTLKMLCGILTPTKGDILLDGIPLTTKNRNEINKKIGAIFGNRSVLWWDIPVIESYRALKTIYSVPDEIFKKNLNDFTDILNLGPLLDLPERQLSLGQKMKCNIAAAFLHNPEIVFLDEPTIGLDTSSKIQIRKFIQLINEQKNTTFLITSHDFQDIESLCKRIILINHGKVIWDDSIIQVKKRFSTKKQIHFEFENNPWYEKNRIIFPKIDLKRNTSTDLILEYDTNTINYLDLIGYINSFVEAIDFSISNQNIESMIQQLIITNDKQESAF